MSYFWPLIAVVLSIHTLKLSPIFKAGVLGNVAAWSHLVIPLVALPYFYGLDFAMIGLVIKNPLTDICLGLLTGLALRLFFDELPAYAADVWRDMHCACGKKPASSTSVEIKSTLAIPEGASRAQIAFSVVFVRIVLPFLEELIGRGLIYTILFARLGLAGALIISSLLFAGGHWQEYGTKRLPLFFAYGMAYAWLFFITGSLLAPVAAHVVFNVYAEVSVLTNIYLRKNGISLPLITHRSLPAFLHGVLAARGRAG